MGHPRGAAQRHRQKYSDSAVLEALEGNSLEGAARTLDVDPQGLKRRKERIERRYVTQHQIAPHREPLSVPNGIVVIGGDAHFWPGHTPFMHRAFCWALAYFKEAKTLRAVICNGDMMDFASMSRWPVINWERQPDAADEIEWAQDRMAEIENCAGRVPKLWPGGNHDLRFNNWIAAKSDGKLRNIKGTHLKDSFPNWMPCWSVMINEEFGFRGCTFVKHRIRGGVFAVRNNVLACGTHIVTNHLHAANVWGHTLIPGTLYGVDSGCIAEINSPQFLYLEDNPCSWREGFVVLEYSDGALLPPQLVSRHPEKTDHIVFRGETIRI